MTTLSKSLITIIVLITIGIIVYGGFVYLNGQGQEAGGGEERVSVNEKVVEGDTTNAVNSTTKSTDTTDVDATDAITTNDDIDSDVGYVALEDITMDTSKWVTYRNEELGVELQLPGELFAIVMQTQSKSSLQILLNARVGSQPAKAMQIEIDNLTDYYQGITSDQFKMRVPLFEGEALPLQSSRLLQYNNLIVYDEMREATTEYWCTLLQVNPQQEVCDPASVPPKRSVVNYQYYSPSTGQTYSLFMQIDANDSVGYLSMFQSIGESFRVIND